MTRRRLLAILAAVLLAGLLVAAALDGLYTFAYAVAAIIICGGVARFVLIGREVEAEHATARTRQLTLDTSRRAGVIDLTAHRERLGVADETRPNKRRSGSGA